MTSQNSDLPLAPPSAVRRDHIREFHGDSFQDPYEWLRDKDSPEVIAHLQAETAYAEAATAQLAPLREQLFQEVRYRVQETDLSVPWRRGDWWYFARTEEGGEHAVQCRVPADAGGWEPPRIVAGQPLPGEQTLLDGNERARPHDFWSLGAFDITHDGTRMAWAEDTTGDERFTVRVHDLSTERTLDDEIPETSYGAFLSPAGDAVFYTEVDDTWRPWRLRRHVLGTPLEQDITIAQEDDPGLWLGAELSSDRRWLVLEAGCSEYSEVSILRVEEAGEQSPLVVVPRSARVLASAEPLRIDGRDVVLLQHDHQAPDGRVSLIELSDLPAGATSPGDDDGPADREQTSDDGLPPGIDIMGPREGLRVLGFAATEHHLVVEVREDTLPGLRVLPLDGLGTERQAPPRALEVPGELTAVSLTAAEPDSPVLRFTAESFVIPRRVFDLIFEAPGPDLPEPILRREQPVLGGYSAADYSVERDWAQAEDGTRIPITLIRRRDAPQPAPAVVYAYGSYEISMDPSFSYSRISLLDRGVVWAIAHVRGGGELGRQWYESGKKEHKRRTFTDVVAVTRHLGGRSDIDADRIVLMGGSAGGLLVGAVLNLAPELYCGAVAAVPFVDPLTSMLMPELPLTALEWEEWGNPIDSAEVYRTMQAYSPYENIAPRDHPPILAVTSLHDTRVLYVEPAKWVAALRHENSDKRERILMRIEMAGGHGGASGRYQQWRDNAWEDAWALERLGLA
ncbi:S9 family peptidase [Kocuria sp. p3-SID1433]|uniref:S9 family peptidase n=1 Tax=unclassified Kocuria TaxID=2649579 RepID=UPI0021A287F5|nr:MULTISPECIES: S9 family peptidase [unclassified Kocuria]MCT1601045.1 S9 family peptidase [Kocuria sp. p3-SID1428]MCT2179311.1 S9 family peptidase [Kocuria sp. p3-SID1433]